MNVYRTSGKAGKGRICVVLAVVALAGLALAVAPAMAGPAAANLQAAHAAYATEGTTLGAVSSGGAAFAATPAMLRAALEASRTSGTALGAGNTGGVVAAVPLPVPNAAPQPFGKAVPVSEPGIGSGIAVLVAAAALLAVGLIAGLSSKSRSSAEQAGATAAPTSLLPTASASAAPDDRLRHAA